VKASGKYATLVFIYIYKYNNAIVIVYKLRK
jgi:hypothetical protein